MSDDAASSGAPAHPRSVPREARPFHGQPAGIVSRSMAGVVDALVVMVFVFALWAGWGAVRFLAHPARFTFPSPSFLVNTTVGCGIAFLYFTVAWATTGRTYGAQLLGLRVVTDHGARVHWGVSALRSALCVVFPVGLLWTVVNQQNRSVQDLLLRTCVIYDWSHQPARNKGGPPEHEDGPRG